MYCGPVDQVPTTGWCTWAWVSTTDPFTGRRSHTAATTAVFELPTHTWTSTWESITVKPDKAWRWFDRFRTHPQPPAPAAGTVLALRPRKSQNRRSMAQITQAKRRNFVHKLRKQSCTS